jgi:hypothetical protein
VTASWGDDLKPPLKAGSLSTGRLFGSPARLSRNVTVADQAAGETFYTLVKIGTGSVRGSGMRFGVVANLGSALRVCALNVDAEHLTASD